MPHINTPVAFDTQCDVVVVGHNSENADYTNPRGEEYGFSSYVRAIDAQGNTSLLHVATERWERDALEPAERLAAALTVRLEKLGRVPVGFESWVAGRPVYGSEAYELYGREDDLAWERELEYA